MFIKNNYLTQPRHSQIRCPFARTALYLLPAIHRSDWSNFQVSTASSFQFSSGRSVQTYSLKTAEPNSSENYYPHTWRHGVNPEDDNPKYSRPRLQQVESDCAITDIMLLITYECRSGWREGRNGVTLWNLTFNWLMSKQWVPLFLSLPLAWQPNAVQGRLVLEVSRSHTKTHQSVGLIWTSDQPVTETCTWQHTTLIRHIHDLGGIRTRNPSQRTAANIHLRTVSSSLI